jgi:hypothetical protein
MGIPDPIQFIAGRDGGPLEVPRTGQNIENNKALNWLPILRGLVVEPGSSGVLASAFINQARSLASAGGGPAAIVDLEAIDDGIEAMLEVGV